MKLLKTGAFTALLMLCFLHSPAQDNRPPVNEPNYNKQKIFVDLPEKFDVNLANLEALLPLQAGTLVNTTIAAGLRLTGTIVSTSKPSDATVKSVVVKTFNREQATLTFTRIINQDGSITYIGRMISKEAGDALEIVKENNQYIFRKTGFYDLINE